MPYPCTLRYISALVADINKKVGNTRRLFLLAHSHGAVAAYGIAHALGSRVLKLIVCGRRSVHGPTPPLLREVFLISELYHSRM